MLSEQAIEQIITQLERLGYFKYTEPGFLEEIREDLWFGFKTGTFNPTTFETPPFHGKEYRYFSLDFSEIEDLNSIVDLLQELEVLFSRNGLKILIQDNSDDTLRINEKSYFFPDSRDLHTLVYHLAELLNDQLTLQQSENRCYLVSDGMDTGGILLTPALQIIFETHLEDETEIPLLPDEWLKHFKG